MTLTRRAVKRKPTTEDVLSQVEMSLEKRDELIKNSEEDINIPNIMDPRYRQGGTGFINFCNHFVRVPIYKKGDTQPTWTPLKDLPDEEWRPGVSYKTFWEKQCNIARKALKMKDGRFIYRVIVLCWPRGDGKSVMAVLIQIWKFFCFRAQTIVLGANSRDQIKFVHFDIIRDIILNSPLLLYVIEGRKNVKEKEIRRYFRGEDEQRYNSIRAITTSTGIVSNITGYTFSEIFDMKNPKFFYQLDGSIRNIPNALGIIDSTVSAKDHALYNLYEIFIEKKDPTVFFSYRYSLKGQAEDYWNPQMDQKQLDAYRVKFPPAEYAQYFTNLWSSGTIRMFSPEQVLSIYYLKTVLGEGHVKLLSVLRERLDLKDYTEQMEKDNSNELSIDIINDNYKKIRSIEKSLVPVSNLYNIEERYGICTLEDLNILSKEYETDFVILAGFDRSDPMAIHGARSIFSLIAKGCVGSQKMGFSYTDVNALEYIYFLIGLDVVEPNTLKQMKDIIIRCNDEFDDVDSICTERWGMFDFMEWCEENQFPNEAIQPSYNRQRTFFGELYTAIAKGNFKSPFINIPGSRGIDILKEELEIFMQDEKSKWFGSPEKNSRNGIQDDVIYSIGLAMYGGLTLTVDDFRIRHMKSPGFMFVQEKQVYGKY